MIDDPGRLERPIRRRKDDFTSLWDIELGYRDGEVQLAAGTTSGYKFELFLRDLITISGGVAIANFDELPVPYRAVATNLETGAMRVFETGDLARVMRASMSVPGAFAPVQIDGQLYVDGGLVRNLPVDVARATCADVVIAVNLGTPLGKRDQLKSVFAVALQSVNLMTELNVSQSLSSLKETDVLIYTRSHRDQLRGLRAFRRGDQERERRRADGSDRLLAPAAAGAGLRGVAGSAGEPARRRRSRSRRFGSRPTPSGSIRKSSRASSAPSPATPSRARRSTAT